ARGEVVRLWRHALLHSSDDDLHDHQLWSSATLGIRMGIQSPAVHRLESQSRGTSPLHLLRRQAHEAGSMVHKRTRNSSAISATRYSSIFVACWGPLTLSVSATFKEGLVAWTDLDHGGLLSLSSPRRAAAQRRVEADKARER